MEKRSADFFSEKGMTLVEILASIVILSIIIVSLLTMFVQSSRTNSYSKNMMNATYVAEASMEEINKSLSVTTSLTNLTGYSKICSDSGVAVPCYYEKNSTIDGHYVKIKLAPKDSLVKVKVFVYNNSSELKLEAQMEKLASLMN